MTQQDFNNSLQFIQSVLNNDLVPALNTLQLSPYVDPIAMDSIIMHENTIITDLNNLITALPTLKGDKGDQGLQGLKGDTGFDGSQGLQGPAGAQGLKGDTGLQGPIGPVGPQGADGSIPYQKVISSASQQSTVTTLANLTELSLPLLANSIYEILCFVTFQSSATITGLNLGISTPSGCKNLIDISVPIVNTASASRLTTTFPNSAVASNLGNVLGTGVSAINNNHTAVMRGVLVTGANAGNCQIMFASEVSASAVTVQAGSYLHFLKLA